MALNEINYEDIINEIRPTLINSTFQNANQGLLTITEENFNTWKKLIERDLLPLHYENGFTFSTLKMIIIGSSGVVNFNDALAMIPTINPPQYIPHPTLTNLIKSLYNAFHVEGSVFEVPNERNAFYDYGCRHLMKNVLFINVCLTTNIEDMTNAVCSIRFINQILKVAEERQNKLAVLDFRMVYHKHVQNISRNFPGENGYADWGQYNQTDEAYRINNVNTYHYYDLLCHPMNLRLVQNENETPDVNFTETFQNLDRRGYPIRQMYRPPLNW